MNIISYILAGLVAILSVVQIWWDHLLKYFFSDGRTNDHKIMRKRLLWLTLILFVLNQLAGLANNYQKKKKAEIERGEFTTQINTLNTNQTNLVQSFDSERKNLNIQITNLIWQTSTINSNQLKLSEQHQNLLSEIATNQQIDPDLRQRIVDSDRRFEVVDSQVVDLNQWELKLKGRLRDDLAQQQIEREKKLKSQQSIYEKCLPYYDYAITTLRNKLGSVAIQRGDKVLSDYQGLPTHIDQNVGDTNVAEIKFLTKTNWCFQITVNGKDGDDGRRCLTIKCQGGSLWITPFFQASRLDTYVRLSSGETIPNLQPLEDFKKTINESIGNLIAAQLIESKPN